MQLSRQHRLVAAFIALTSMLFVQLAVAAYACPSRQIAQVAELAAMSAHVDEHEHMNGCEGADGEKSALCHAHCQPDSQSLDKPQLPDVSTFMALALVSTVFDSGALLQPIIAPRADLFLSRITSPPLFIRNCCFRI
ncbi:hypothetical protein [Herbaspirillum sp. ST 5-3]|uniref:hypothetical protein n=1 Tax=Oxalobacteraceae TaxID=75682 RepID=UPI0014560259|nr:hypothetical protein [Herbaspirillum sp. ST 5-3]